jgi:lipopolysaccharide/colanic/teichoic acid biosynthesis glycosyltransferase
VAVFSPFAEAPFNATSMKLGLPSIDSLDALTEPIDVVIAVDRMHIAAYYAMPKSDAVGATELILSDGPADESLWLPTRALGIGIGVRIDRAGHIDRNPHVKRIMDLLLAGVVALPALVLVGLAAVAVKIIDPGPVFFRHRRIGMNGRPFDVLKVRSMYQDAERRLDEHLRTNPCDRMLWERQFKLQNDARILPAVGSFIRKTSIDELPQLWNVWRGEMSLVGPRPFPEYHLKEFDEQFRAMRSTVPPGLTGLWQVTARSDADLETQKAEDEFYVRNRSFWLDLYILLETVPAVVTGRGAR